MQSKNLKKDYPSVIRISNKAVSPKIAIFYKPITLKVCFSALMFIYIVSTPMKANAGFLSFMGDILGSDNAVVSIPTVDPSKNSQTLELLEPSITPDLKNQKDKASVVIVDDQALETKTGPMGPAGNLQDYVTSAPVNVYIVKKGDTLKSIAKKFKVPVDAIIYANPDIKREDLDNIGQKLVVFQVKSEFDKANKPEKDRLAKEKSAKEKAEKAEKVDKLTKANTMESTPVVETPVQTVSSVTEANSDSSTEESNNIGPVGKIANGFIWPFPEGVGRVTQRLHGPNGVDLGAPKGTPIYAIADGTILIADGSGWNGGYGLYVVENFDDGTQSLYAHMSKVVAVSGAKVKQGDLIGYVGSTGHSTGPHLHIERRGGVNPFKDLKVNNTSEDFHD